MACSAGFEKFPLVLPTLAKNYFLAFAKVGNPDGLDPALVYNIIEKEKEEKH